MGESLPEKKYKFRSWKKVVQATAKGQEINDVEIDVLSFLSYSHSTVCLINVGKLNLLMVVQF
jgi:hypothetical protein